MRLPNYKRFFIAATAGNAPFDYQCRLACGERDNQLEDRWLASGAQSASRLIAIPTGCGKTAAAILAWLWNRLILNDGNWPRRLVYCLPMRTLVEQTVGEVQRWFANLIAKASELKLDADTTKRLQRIQTHSPVILMGGEELAPEKRDWDIYPEHEAILIGTQDMLLSRALNRGYGMSRYRWPMHFGFLNNDCLWVLDETQLMGPGLATTVQLEAFRSALWQTEKPCMSWWMSATSANSIFTTRDRDELAVPVPEAFSPFREGLADLGDRLSAEKSVHVLPRSPKMEQRDQCGVFDLHLPGRLTLLVVNTVDSAQRLYEELASALTKAKKGKKAVVMPKLILVHSRFRASDRSRIMKEIEIFRKRQPSDGSPISDSPGLIIVSTQVIEAGYDLSAARLWSEVAPWASVIQRMGRLNREGLQPDARAYFWMPKRDDVENGPDAPNAKRVGPYDAGQLNSSKTLLEKLCAFRLEGLTYRAALDKVLDSAESREALRPKTTVVVRPDDVHGLFSTEPDLAGGFTNIAPYVRDDDRNVDVLVYWRDFDRIPPADLLEAGREETVSVPFYDVRRFVKSRKADAFLWDEEAGSWVRLGPDEIVAGMTILLPISAGGYSSTKGWTGGPEDKPPLLPTPSERHHSLFSENEGDIGWQTLGEHTSAVDRAADNLTVTLNIPRPIRQVFSHAALWHDVGKAHARWQEPLVSEAPRRDGSLWGKFKGVHFFRPGFRHEALSLLAAWEQRRENIQEASALALYLIASHHGKVRTVLRATGNGDDLFGLVDVDAPLEWPGHLPRPTRIDTSRKAFAGRGTFNWGQRTYSPEEPSWVAIVEELLGPAWREDLVTAEAVPQGEPRNLGPDVAYLEAVFRASDARASRGDFAS